MTLLLIAERVGIYMAPVILADYWWADCWWADDWLSIGGLIMPLLLMAERVGICGWSYGWTETSPMPGPFGL
jgi:hypothetical protein